MAYPHINIEFKKWIEIQQVCNWMFMEAALTGGDPIKLPYGFGVVAISKRPTQTFVIKNGEPKKRLPVDWKKSKQEGFLIYNMNFHTSGWRYKWKWFTRTARILESQIWALKPCRKASRAIACFVNKPFYAQLYKEWKNTYQT